MTTKTIEDLRDHLFAAIQGVRDKTLTIEQAKTISDLSQVVVNTAKVEVDFVRATERRESQFLLGTNGQAASPAGRQSNGALPSGILGITRHILADD